MDSGSYGSAIPSPDVSPFRGSFLCFCSAGSERDHRDWERSACFRFPRANFAELPCDSRAPPSANITGGLRLVTLQPGHIMVFSVSFGRMVSAPQRSLLLMDPRGTTPERSFVSPADPLLDKWGCWLSLPSQGPCGSPHFALVHLLAR